MEPSVLLTLLIVAFLVLAVLVVRTVNNSLRLNDIEWHLKELRGLSRRISDLELSVGQDKLAEVRSETAKKETQPLKQPAQPAFRPVPEAARAPREEPKPSRTREEWEALIGGKLLNRIGALALIIGVGFFLKYAFDNNWINEITRVGIGALLGLGCLAAARRTHKHGFQIFAQGLVGAGIAILYLSVYASFNYYHIVPQWAAFLMMSFVTVLTFANGLYYDSLAVALLGWAGGFLTPILLSTGQANEVGLFGYIGLLDAGLAGLLVRKKQWYVLEPLTLIATWLMFAAWQSEFYTESDLWVTVFFIMMFWGIFLFLDIFRSRPAVSEKRIEQIVPALNVLFYYPALYALVNKEHHDWMSLATLAVGAVYLAAMLMMQRRNTLTQIAQLRHSLTVVTLLVLATAIQFEQFTTVIFWSFEAAMLVWCASLWRLRYLEQAAFVLFGFTAFKLVYFTPGSLSYVPLERFSLILNERAGAFFALAASLFLGTIFALRWKDEKGHNISTWLHYAWIVVMFVLLTVETNDYSRFRTLNGSWEEKALGDYTRLTLFGAIWMLYSLPLVWFGLRRSVFPLIVSGIGSAALAVIFGSIRGIAFDPVELFLPVLNVRFGALILLAAGLVLQTSFMKNSKGAYSWIDDVINVLRVGIVVVVLVLLTGETRDFFQKKIAALLLTEGTRAEETAALANLQQLCLSGVWLVYSFVLMSLGIWRRLRGLRFVAIGLFGVTILKIFVYDLSFLQTLYRIFSFVGLGLILLGVSYIYQKYKDIILGRG